MVGGRLGGGGWYWQGFLDSGFRRNDGEGVAQGLLIVSLNEVKGLKVFG